MEKKYSRSHIDEKHITTEGYECKVIDGGSKNGYCTIQIENWVHEARYCEVKVGKIKYPYHKSIHGVGYIGTGMHNVSRNSKLTKAYKTCHDMMARCYSEKCQIKHPTYKDVAVCEEWHNYQNFAKWFEDNYVDGYHLDKDLLSGDKKIYSPSMCIFIPQGLNTFLSNNHKNNNSGKTGVMLHSRDKKWTGAASLDGKSKSIGYFSVKDDAVLAYASLRREYSDIWKYRMTGILPKEAIENIR